MTRRAELPLIPCTICHLVVQFRANGSHHTGSSRPPPLHKEKIEEGRIGAIIDALVEKMYSHGHAIGRGEATELGLPVDKPDGSLEILSRWKFVLLGGLPGPPSPAWAGGLRLRTDRRARSGGSPSQAWAWQTRFEQLFPSTDTHLPCAVALQAQEPGTESGRFRQLRKTRQALFHRRQPTRHAAVGEAGEVVPQPQTQQPVADELAAGQPTALLPGQFPRPAHQFAGPVRCGIRPPVR